MNRRGLLKGMGVIALYGSFPAILGEFISSCKTNDKRLRAGFFSEDEFHLLEQITDVLLPATATPGAAPPSTRHLPPARAWRDATRGLRLRNDAILEWSVPGSNRRPPACKAGRVTGPSRSFLPGNQRFSSASWRCSARPSTRVFTRD